VKAVKQQTVRLDAARVDDADLRLLADDSEEHDPAASEDAGDVQHLFFGHRHHNHRPHNHVPHRHHVHHPHTHSPNWWQKDVEKGCHDYCQDEDKQMLAFKEAMRKEGLVLNFRDTRTVHNCKLKDVTHNAYMGMCGHKTGCAESKYGLQGYAGAMSGRGAWTILPTAPGRFRLKETMHNAYLGMCGHDHGCGGSSYGVYGFTMMHTGRGLWSFTKTNGRYFLKDVTHNAYVGMCGVEHCGGSHYGVKGYVALGSRGQWAIEGCDITGLGLGAATEHAQSLLQSFRRGDTRNHTDEEIDREIDREMAPETDRESAGEGAQESGAAIIDNEPGLTSTLDSHVAAAETPAATMKTPREAVRSSAGELSELEVSQMSKVDTLWNKYLSTCEATCIRDFGKVMKGGHAALIKKGCFTFCKSDEEVDLGKTWKKLAKIPH